MQKTVFREGGCNIYIRIYIKKVGIVIFKKSFL